MYDPTPALIPVESLEAMFATRDGILAAWQAGAMSAEEADRRMRALTAVDGSGAWWRLRPSEVGVLLIRIDASGEARAATAEEFAPLRPGPSGAWRWAKRVGVAAFVAGWAVVLWWYLIYSR